jgi:hypothetical protein
MRRRDLVRLLTAVTASGAALRAGSARAQSDEISLDENVDPYFLDSGEFTDSEREAVIAVEEIQEQQMQGRQVVMPRGLRPERAPTYRFVHWNGDIGDPGGAFVSPLSVRPQIGDLPVYRINGQILGFHGASEDWRGRSSQGTLTVELRAQVSGEPMTWLFAQQFDMDSEGFTNLGYEYLTQRSGSPEPAVTGQPSVALRIQLMRSPRRAGVALRKFISTALVVTGALQASIEDRRSRQRALPPIRVPAMLQEAAALTQALIGGTAEETPIWRGGFSSYSLAAGGSRLGLVPGYWMAIDAARESDLRGVMLEDIGGFVSPTRAGEPLDANYVVFGFEIDAGPAPAYLNLGPQAVPKSAGEG